MLGGVASIMWNWLTGKKSTEIVDEIAENAVDGVGFNRDDSPQQILKSIKKVHKGIKQFRYTSGKGCIWYYVPQGNVWWVFDDIKEDSKLLTVELDIKQTCKNWVNDPQKCGEGTKYLYKR